MTAYQVTGWISVVCFLLSLTGIVGQWNTIRHRRRQMLAIPEAERTIADRPTDVLSLNQFFASFLAFYSFLVYGLCLDPFNHFLVWTRLPAVVLTILILREIRTDRDDMLSSLAWIVSIVLLTAAGIPPLAGTSIAEEAGDVATVLAIVAAAVFAQGVVHQIFRIRRTGRTGAISLRMHQLTTLKDASTIAFALTIPDGKGWPLLTVGLVGVMTKSVLMWHFRWARLSPVAADRRPS